MAGSGEMAGFTSLSAQASEAASLASFTKKSLPPSIGNASTAGGTSSGSAAGQLSSEMDDYGRGRRYGHVKPESQALAVDDFDDEEPEVLHRSAAAARQQQQQGGGASQQRWAGAIAGIADQDSLAEDSSAVSEGPGESRGTDENGHDTFCAKRGLLELDLRVL